MTVMVYKIIEVHMNNLILAQVVQLLITTH